MFVVVAQGLCQSFENLQTPFDDVFAVIGAVVQCAAAFVALVIDGGWLGEQVEQSTAGEAGEPADHALYQHFSINIKL